jgi:hypothetical protein
MGQVALIGRRCSCSQLLAAFPGLEMWLFLKGLTLES